MESIETKTKSGEALLAETTKIVQEVTEEKVRESFNNVVAYFEEEFGLSSPPYQRMFLMYLFAKLEGREPPVAISEKLKNKSFREYIEYDENKFNQLIGKAPKDVQEYVIAALIVRLEPKEKEYEEEMVRDGARDELIDFVHNSGLSYTEQTSVYKELLEQIKSREAIAVPA